MPSQVVTSYSSPKPCKNGSHSFTCSYHLMHPWQGLPTPTNESNTHPQGGNLVPAVETVSTRYTPIGAAPTGSSNLVTVTVIFFANTLDAFPKINRVGDILRVHRVKVQTYHKAGSGSGSGNETGGCIQYQMVASQYKCSFISFSRKIDSITFLPITRESANTRVVPPTSAVDVEDAVDSLVLTPLETLMANWQYFTTSSNFTFLLSDLMYLDFLFYHSVLHLAYGSAGYLQLCNHSVRSVSSSSSTTATSNSFLPNVENENIITLSSLRDRADQYYKAHILARGGGIYSVTNDANKYIALPSGMFLDVVIMVGRIDSTMSRDGSASSIGNANMRILGWDGSLDGSAGVDGDNLMKMKTGLHVGHVYQQIKKRFMVEALSRDNTSANSNLLEICQRVIPANSVISDKSLDVHGECVEFVVDDKAMAAHQSLLSSLRCGMWVSLQRLKIKERDQHVTQTGAAVGAEVQPKYFFEIGMETTLNVLPPYHM